MDVCQNGIKVSNVLPFVGKGTQSRLTKANLAKEPPHSASLDAVLNLIHSDRRANVQQGVCQNTGGRKLSSTLVFQSASVPGRAV